MNAGTMIEPVTVETAPTPMLREIGKTITRTFFGWPVRQWVYSVAVLTLSVLTGWVLTWRAGALLGALLILVPAFLAAVLLALVPGFYLPWIARPAQATKHLLLWLIRWDRACEYVGLGARPRRWRKSDKPEKFTAAWCVPVPSAQGLDMRIKVPRGMSAEDVAEVTPSLAAAMKATSYAYQRVNARSVRIRLTLVDALSTITMAPRATGKTPVLLGIDEAGQAVTIDPHDAVNTVVQGKARSGKSVFTYGLLSGLAHRDDVVVVGCDPSGILLRPWLAGRGGEWIATGTDDMERHALILEAVVTEMTNRLHDLENEDDDAFRVFNAARPVIVVVLEEWPGLISAARSFDPDIAKRIERAHGRLNREALKVGIRLVTLAQRMSSKAMDTDDRTNYARRITFCTDNADSLRMLHEGASVPPIEEVVAWSPGVGIIEGPGLPLIRWRSNLITYRTYLNRVRAGATRHGYGWRAPALEQGAAYARGVSVQDGEIDDTAELPVITSLPLDRPRRTQPKQPRRPRPSTGTTVQP